MYGAIDDGLQPDMDDLEAQLIEQSAQGTPIRMVVLCTPCNPTGVVVPKPTLERAAELCGAHGAWLVLDNTYEYFTYGDHVHSCLEGDHIVNIFSFSKGCV